jgi:methionyl-tRNA formyltransferase
MAPVVMRVIFMGSPDFAVPALAAIIAAGHDVVCVYSQPPRPAGRGKADRTTPVHAFASAAGIEVRTPVRLKDPADQAAFAGLNADVAVVAAYGLILPQVILDAPRFGCINLHGSRLPRWRGAAPIQRAIEAGDTETGIDLMQMEAGLDTGPVLLRHLEPIVAIDTGGTLHDRLSAAAADLVVSGLAALSAGILTPEKQPEIGVTYASKITKDELKIDWAMPAEVLANKIRAMSPSPGMWCEAPGLGRLKIHFADVESGTGAPGELLDNELLVACGISALRLSKVQREGRGVVTRDEFLRGQSLLAGTRLS